MLGKIRTLSWLILMLPLGAKAQGEGCKNGAPRELKEPTFKAFTLTIFKDIELEKNRSNKNFNLVIDGGFFGRCILFSKDAVLPAGEYTSDGAHGIFTDCRDKRSPHQGEMAYTFTKFDSIMGKDVLRIQCFRTKGPLEQEREAALQAAGGKPLPDRYAPDALQTKHVLESQNSPLRARVTLSE